jgi:hypothetical protein
VVTRVGMREGWNPVRGAALLTEEMFLKEV